MSLSGLLSIARSALLTHRMAMNVTAQNVANASTPGYSRQRLLIHASEPLRGPYGTIGTGVADGGILRARDQFLDASFRRESGLLGNSTAMRSFLSQIEGAIDEPSETGIAAALDDLFQSFSDLANDPTSPAARTLVQHAGRRFTELLNRLDGRFAQAADDVVTQMRSDVSAVNRLAKDIADLNQQILSAGGPNRSAPDLQDRRDLLVDELSGLMGIRVLEREDGTLSLMTGDTMLVDGAVAVALEVKDAPGGGFGVGRASGSALIDPGGGSLQALVDLSTTRLPAMRAQLDGFARGVVTEVNALHRSGYTLIGATNTDFFDPAGVTAGSITLAPGILNSPNAIAAGATGAPGDGDIALLIASLATDTVASLGDQTLRNYYTSFASSVGAAVHDATNDAETQQSLADRADILRAGIAGVSIDEEMVILIGQQEAYSAAARLIRVADEMMQDLLSII